MFGLGPTELILIAVILLLIFGARRLPDIGKGLGGAIREFKNIKKEVRLDETTKNNQDSEPSLEAKVVEKVVEQVPGVKKAVELKKKMEKINKIIK